MMYARDVSNWTKPLSADILRQWQAEGVGLVIIQCFPTSYPQYAEQLDQMRLCVEVGLPFDCYVYDYLGDPTWLWAALDGIEQAPEKPRMVWLDEEDVETEEGWSTSHRAAAIEANWQTVLNTGYPCGIYTGRWWWRPRVGVMDLSGVTKLWTSQYDGIPDTSTFVPFGGWSACRIKQYAGSQPDGTDLNVLSAEEEAEIMADCATYKEAIDHGVQRLWLELAKKTTLSKKIVREIAAELYAALQS